MPIAEFEQQVKKEMMDNPALEEGAPEEEENVGTSADEMENNDTGIDSNIDNYDQYNVEMRRLIKENNIKLVIDLHGASKDREFDIEFGTLNNLSADFSTIKELEEAFTENHINNINHNNPFKGGAITQGIYSFDDVDVKFTGVDGNGEVEFEITNDREIYDYISFYCDSYYLEEGDEVTVTFGSYSSPEDMADYCANEFGCIPTETEKTFTVEGLGHYIEDASEITSESVLGTMYQDGIDAISDTLYSVYEDDEFSIVQAEYVGCAVAYKEYYGNYVYVVYKITADVTNPDGDTEQIVFYNYAKFEDGIMNGDGTCTYEDLYNVSHNTAKFDVGKYIASIYGYEDIESLREDVDSDGDWWENYTYNY